MKVCLTDKLNSYSRNSVLLVLFAIVITLFIRKTDALINPQFWAEDGAVFFLQQYENGASALFRSSADYLHLVPRLIALIANAFFPYHLIPTIYNYSCLLITPIVALSIFSSRFHVNNKPLIALTIVLIPQYANEVFLNITNLQWILSIMLIVVLFKETPAKKYGNVIIQYACDLMIIIICGLTGPFIIILMPFYGWKWISKKNLYNSVILIAVATISLIQLSFIVQDLTYSQGIGINFETYSAIIGHKFIGNFFLGHILAYKINHYILSFLYLGTLILILHLAYHKKSRFIFFSIGISLFFLLVAFYRSNNPEDLIFPGCGTRYFYIPYVMLTWSLIALLEKQAKWKNILLTMVLILILISSLTSGFHSKPFIDYNWKLYSESIGKKDIIVPINPEGWEMSIKAHSK